ncbi:MAG TPA: MgtC/SapB family protein [Aquifex aeolicus]|uniref:MgtC/SapB family protein n=1 Tax=Aquifex aeolicus TaxID=63363 RepID=A0A7C5QDP5_AQUAO|nr:MgtC/SapB family protein [Aquifex aeolicus]
MLELFIEGYPFPLWEGLLRILLSLVLGALIGLERERRRQPAGFRTHTVLAVGSALLSMVSVYIPFAYGGLNVDPSRIASQVVSGIGFLGAGAILRMGISVKGLTTAASLWTTAGIGLAVGAGMYILSFFSTLVILGVLSIMSRIEREFISKKGERLIRITVKGGAGEVERVVSLLGEGTIRKIRREEDQTEILLDTPYGEKEMRDRLGRLLELPSVLSVEII